MGITVQIDNDVLEELEQRARELGVSPSQLLNQMLREGLTTRQAERSPYQQPVFSMGVPRIDLDQALSIAAQDADAETLRKLDE